MRENVGRWALGVGRCAVCGVRCALAVLLGIIGPGSLFTSHGPFFLGFLAPKTSISVARV